MRALILLLALAACSQQSKTQNLVAKLQALTADDLQAATALANATGDANGAACWTFLASLIPTLQPPTTIGAATAIEIARLGQQTLFSEKCAQVGVLTGLPAAF